MENLKTILYAQVVHKNCLLAAVLLNHTCCGLDHCKTIQETENRYLNFSMTYQELILIITSFLI